MSEENQKFELSSIKANNLAEISGFEESQKQLVESNPFVEITDKATYELAKKSRTNLKKGRTTIENQDKSIGTFVSNFRKKVIEISKKLVEITKPHEEKQQAEIDRYEAILEVKKAEEQKAEETRVETIKSKIESTKEELSAIIEKTNFIELEQSISYFQSKVESAKSFDFEEFEFLFNEMIQEKDKEFEQKVASVKREEEARLKKIDDDITNFLQHIQILTGDIIEEGPLENGPGLTEELNQYFEKIDEEDFGKRIQEFKDLKIKMLKKASDKIEREAEIAEMRLDREKNDRINEQRKRIETMREGYFDRIHQMTIDDFEGESKLIEKQLKDSSGIEEDVKTDFDLMVSIVKVSLDQKVKELKEIITAEEKRMEHVVEERTNDLLKAGMKETEDGDFIGFGLTVTAERVFEEDDVAYILEDVENSKTEEIELNAKKEMIVSKGMVKNPSNESWEGFGMVIDLIDLKDDSIESIEKIIDQAKLEDEEVQKRNEILKGDKESLLNYIDSVLAVHGDFSAYAESKEAKELVEILEEMHEDFLINVKAQINTFE